MKTGLKIFGVVLLILTVLFFTGVIGDGCNRSAKQAIKATHIDDATDVYEEFQSTYNACVKLNTDLGNMQATDKDDVMFAQFSKAQRVLQIKTQLNRWVEDYNAKSKMWGRSLWKSKSLPFELNVNDFSNYNNK